MPASRHIADADMPEKSWPHCDRLNHRTNSNAQIHEIVQQSVLITPPEELPGAWLGVRPDSSVTTCCCCTIVTEPSGLVVLVSVVTTVVSAGAPYAA